MQLKKAFEAEHGCLVDCHFGAVGMMKDRLLAGAPCDVLILTEALVEQLTASGELLPGTAKALGLVKTGIAVKRGEPRPDVSTPGALKAALQAATGIYFPDPVKSTAGIHFMATLQKLGLYEQLAGRLRSFPNGATAMKAMAETPGEGLIGCTQVTEILFTSGVSLTANLPVDFELATLYSAAICTRAGNRDLANELVLSLAGDGAAEARRNCGFEN